MPRECQSCGFKWWARFVGPTPRPGAILFGTGTNVALTHQRQERDRYKMCPNCGASKPKTVKAKGFVPTGAVAHAQTAPAGACIDCGRAAEAEWIFCPYCGSLTS